MVTFDVTSPALYAHGIPHDTFAEMRATPGLVWHPYESSGFWAATRYADVKAVSMLPKVFSSGIGHTNLWDLEADALEARRSIIDTDAPDHTRLRRLVSKAFAPNSIRMWEGTTRSIASTLLDEFAERGGGDWVDLVAAPLPIQVILTILGVPVEDADHLVELSNYLVEGTTDRATLAPDAFGNTTPLRLLPFASPASHALFEYGERMYAERKATPRTDLVSQLVLAEDAGDRLSHAEFRNFFHVLVFAGNETTRTAITHGAMAFASNPDQWQRLVDDPSLVDSAVEEILRWATPVLHMRRTAAADTELAGTAIAQGDKVVMWYVSANFDDHRFPDPFRFDIARPDNLHTAFGGGGPHFCLGAFLARMEIKVLLEEMLRRGIMLEQTAPETRVASNFVHGIAAVPMTLAR
jgi:cholest-4-en-3-one 26-monooxygenase